MKRKPPSVCHKWGIYDPEGRLVSWASTRQWAREFARGYRVRKVIITPVGR